MLSILIPTYNCNCYRLVNDLHNQCEQNGVEYEIIVGDDMSRDRLSIIANMKMNELSNCRYLPSDEKVGQATLRNRLAKMSKGEILLFIDSDAQVCSDSFISSYLREIDRADVVIGGIVTPDLKPNELIAKCETADLGMPHSYFIVNRTLRYKYEKKADLRRKAVERNKRPYAEISCFNMMIHRDTFLSVMFDEQCREYGYEDVLFGAEMERRNIRVLHIDNPLQHTGIDTNIQFLDKTETALRTLVKVKDKVGTHSRMYQYAEKCRQNHAEWLVRILYKMTKPLLKHNLLGQKPSLFLFSFYKLGYFLCLEQENT